MDALNALHTRTSAGRVTGPAPEEATLQNIFRAALRAPDHGQLRPWRFLRIEGESLQRLGNLFVAAALYDNPALNAEEQESVRSKALRAPLVIVTVSKAAEHPRIPILEQELSAGSATHAMLVAAHAQGLGAVWRTGPMATHAIVSRGLGLGENEKIIAFLYVGHLDGSPRPLRELSLDDYVQHW
ncbi:MAG: nitroreductase family protein [Gammaproteobacteria bacterium]|nr:nitroreductase family protein [Gammaproteobacteria bacterium]MDP2139373.1 nitroreductase family protein [Gammaproteobacteria bacterium]MDP2346209.1 nitroreductase family protein [Gammaproteobacteria bacterium]